MVVIQWPGNHPTPTRIYRQDYRSLDELADAGEKMIGTTVSGSHRVKNAVRLAREGWFEHQERSMEICRVATDLIDREAPTFLPEYDVSGGGIDMGRYIAGLPDCMVDFPMVQQSHAGSVVTLCADVQCLSSVDDIRVTQRGLAIVGLIMALDRMEHATELWLNDEYYTRKRPTEKLIIRTLVKGVNDFILPERIMCAFAHPDVQRGLGFALASSCPEGGNGDITFGMALMRDAMGSVTETTKDGFPPETIFIPPIRDQSAAPNAEREIRMYMSQLGLIQSDEEVDEDDV